MVRSLGLTEIIFGMALLCTFAAALLARQHSRDDSDDNLAGRRLNRWLIGLSAGTTANSGFIVTAAVGLGYVYGTQWLLLPISWLLGDLIFWHLFPARINRLGHEFGATTLQELLCNRLSGPWASGLTKLVTVTILICLAGYTSAQWLAGQKFLAGAFGLSEISALTLFAILIVSYSSIGGFRGSVYTDTLQAIIRIIGTVIAVAAVWIAASAHPEIFIRNIEEAGGDFLNPAPGKTLASVCGFILGFAAAAIGFGLGQPQILMRYLAGRSPIETRSAWWIYIGFVQSTWIAMTVFGIILRGVMPGLADPETGLSAFFKHNLGPIPTGVIAADVFATIASTSNGLLIAMAQTTKIEFLRRYRISLAPITLAFGLLTMAAATAINGSVVTVALSSISLMGGGSQVQLWSRYSDGRTVPARFL